MNIKDFPLLENPQDIDWLLIQENATIPAFKKIQVDKLIKARYNPLSGLVLKDGSIPTYTAVAGDRLIIIQAMTVNLPIAATFGNEIELFTVKKTTAFNITVNDGSGNTLVIPESKAVKFTFVDSIVGWIYQKPILDTTRTKLVTYKSTAYSLSGSATQQSGFVQLTPAIEGREGIITFTPAVQLVALAEFSWFIHYRIYNGNAADGMTFRIEDSVNNKRLYIELDTFQNAGDIAAQHIKINTQSATISDVATPTRTDINGAFIWVDYKGSSLKLYRNTVNSKPTIPISEGTVNISANFIANPILSVVARTGGSFDAHEILEFKWDDNFLVS